MIQAAIDSEVEGFIERHSGHVDELGRRLVVKNGSLPAREIFTGAGPVEIKHGRVRDNNCDIDERVQITPCVLPAYLRRTDKVEELIPWLYLKGISTGDFAEALQSLLGENAKGLSANVVVRLTIECFSDDFFSRWEAEQETNDVFGRQVRLEARIGFCFIDGNHTYAFAKRDFENTDASLVRGGFILFDDSGDGSGWEVNQLVREIAADGRYELVLNNPNYLFRKK